jgi:Transposase DDE domain group 1
MQRTSSRPKIVVTADGRGVVGHAGARLLTDLADATGLTTAMSDALAPLRQRASGHDPGRIAVDVAVMLADGGEAIADLSVLRGQAELFGPVASKATVWRLLNGLDAAAMDRLRAARARAREVAWVQAAETGRMLSSSVAGYTIPGLVLDVDATIVVCHSEKGSAAKTWKKTFGYHPLLCFLDATGEALAGILRPGNSGSNTTADHIQVLDLALAQIPDAHRHGTDILVRSDSAGATKGFLAHIRGLRDQGVRSFFSVGVAVTEPIRTAITACVDWQAAIDADRGIRDGADIAEITHLIDMSAYPDESRMIVRRERPHPGAQLSLFDTIEGLRHQVFVTDTPRPACSLQLLELRHRGHARVEDRIRTGKDSGFGRFPSLIFSASVDHGRELRGCDVDMCSTKLYQWSYLDDLMILEFFLFGVSRWLLWPITSSARRCPSTLARASRSRWFSSSSRWMRSVAACSRRSSEASEAF